MLDLLLIAVLGAPSFDQTASTGAAGTRPSIVRSAPSRQPICAKRKRRCPPTTTATGTTTPVPSDPAGTVPPGAPGTQDPTLPGSPPNA